MQTEVKEKPVYAVAASVQLPHVSDIEFEASLAELRELAKTLGYTVVRTFVQKRASFDTTGYLGIGKRQEIEHYAAHEAECEIEAILVDHEISPSQARNLEKETGCGVMDRTMVILEIFHNNARSRAASARPPSWPGRRVGNAAVSAAVAPANRIPNSTAARSATALPNCNSKSSPWKPSARRSAPVARNVRAWPALRWSATPMPENRP